MTARQTVGLDPIVRLMETPRAPVDGRYQFVEPAGYQGDGPRWLAKDTSTGNRVVVALVQSTQVAKLEAAQGCLHENLAGILAVTRRVTPDMVAGPIPQGAALAVAELVAGQTLVERLASGAVNAPRAVAWWLRLASAVGRVHAKGGVISTISPFSIVAKPRGRAIPPVLTQLIAPVVAATLSPERLKGSAPTPADDVWALYASLYWALMGAPPYSGSSREELLASIGNGNFAPLQASGIDEPVLQEILARGLSSDRNQRTMGLDELKKSLDAWERGLGLPPRPVRAAPTRSFSGIVSGGLSAANTLAQVVFDYSSLPENPIPEPAPVPKTEPAVVSEPQAAAVGELSDSAGRLPVSPELGAPDPGTPVPVPAAAAVAAQAAEKAKTSSINPFERKAPVWPFAALLGALLLGGVAYFFLGRSAPPLAAPSASATDAAAAAPAQKPAASAGPAESASAASESKMTPEESTNACVISYFEDGTFVPGAQFGFVCEAGDHRDMTDKLYELSEAKKDLERKAAGETKPDAGHAEKGFQVDTVTGDAGVEDVRRPLGWYELLASAVVRKGCCPAAAPVTLPETKGWCEQLQDVVRDLAEDSSRSGDLAARVKRFDKAVDCLFANRMRRPYRYKTEPITEEHAAAFQDFLAHAAVSDAKRRSLGQ